MRFFDFRKHKTLSQAVLAGDLRAVRTMLDKGADPNQCDADDDAYPIHYALNHGPEMVQLLVDHGADVNIPSQRNHAMPLAFAESHGYTAVAAILRNAGARLRTDEEKYSLDPRIRLQMEPKIRSLMLVARSYFPEATPEVLARAVEEKLNLEFPAAMPLQDQRKIRMEVRALIGKECGVKDYMKATEPAVPSPEEVMAETGGSEHELTRRFVEQLIQEGKNPFDGMPANMLRDAEEQTPDLIALARRKFESDSVTGSWRVSQTDDTYRAPRTWDNLPSMAMTPVAAEFSWHPLFESIVLQAPEMELICLVNPGWTNLREDAARRIQLLYEFADDPQLVLMRFLAPVPGTEQVIVRAWFGRETVSQVSATNLFDLTEHLSQLARQKGLNTLTVE